MSASKTGGDDAIWATLPYADYCALQWIVEDDKGNVTLHPNVSVKCNKDKAGQWTVGLTRTDLPGTNGKRAIPSTRWRAFRIKFDVKGDKDAQYNKDKIDKAVSVSLVATDPALLASLNQQRIAHELAAVQYRNELEIDKDTADTTIRKYIRRNFGWSDHECQGITKEQRKQNALDPTLYIGPPTPDQRNHGYITMKISEKKLDLPTPGGTRTTFELKPKAFINRETNESVSKEVLKSGCWIAANVALIGVNPASVKGFARWILFDGLWKFGPPMASGAETVEESERSALFDEADVEEAHMAVDEPGIPVNGVSQIPVTGNPIGSLVNPNGKRPREENPSEIAT